MAHDSHAMGGTISLEEIDITAQLAQRPARLPDYAVENRALVHLAHEMATHPAHILQTLVETALACTRYALANLERFVELDLNPVIVRPRGRGAVAVDALIRLA